MERSHAGHFLVAGGVGDAVPAVGAPAVGVVRRRNGRAARISGGVMVDLVGDRVGAGAGHAALARVLLATCAIQAWCSAAHGSQPPSMPTV